MEDFAVIDCVDTPMDPILANSWRVTNATVAIVTGIFAPKTIGIAVVEEVGYTVAQVEPHETQSRCRCCWAALSPTNIYHSVGNRVFGASRYDMV